MKIGNKSYDFGLGAVLDELECEVCEATLDWEFEDGYERTPQWVGECCGVRYELTIKSVRATVERE